MSDRLALASALEAAGIAGDAKPGHPEAVQLEEMRAVQAHLAAITVPEFSTVFAVARPISGDIQIQFVPLALRQ